MEMMVVKWVMVVVVAEEEAEREEKKSCINREEADFLAYFGPDFLLPQAMKSTTIYRRCKREILSILRKNFST